MAFKCDIPATPTTSAGQRRRAHHALGLLPRRRHRLASARLALFRGVADEARMRVHDGEKVTELSFPAGHSYMRPAGVTHDVMNGGDEPMAFVEIEIKSPDRLATLN